ncbi:MAG: DUF3536 domain-containing protein, partial [Bryobacteraceae bacterium]|nr:DUF3536 domain-containing protein [Bryobacteraceae bacterium]
LLEMQRHAMLMYTSCGWFFDEISGIETVQVIQYAGRVVQLALELFEEERIESGFLVRLSEAKSNVPEQGDASQVYQRIVSPALVDLRKVGAHYAITSVFRPYGEEARVYCYDVKRIQHRQYETGRFRMVIGRALLTSNITQESGDLIYGVLHFGDHNLHGGVSAFRDEAEFENLLTEASEVFSRAAIPEVIRVFDRGFGTDTYSLKSLFRDEQRNTLDRILVSTLDEAESVYRQLYEHHAPLMRFLADLKIPLPNAFHTTAQYALNSHLRLALAAAEPDVTRVRTLLEEAKRGQVELDKTTLEFTFRKTVEALAHRVSQDPVRLSELRLLATAVDLATSLPFPVTLWSVQNIVHDLLRDFYPLMIDTSSTPSEEAGQWVELFRDVAKKLSFKVA